MPCSQPSTVNEGFIADLNAAVAGIRKLPRVRFEIGLGDSVDRWLQKRHADGAVHEPATIAAFLAVAQRFDCRTIFDVGALYGYFSLVARQFFPAADIIAFESHPGIARVLARNIDKIAACVCAVVSDTRRNEVKVWFNAFNIYEEPAGGWEGLKDIPGAFKVRGNGRCGKPAVVNFITLDWFCAKYLDSPPDLVKIDVEAYQAHAVRGAAETIAQARPIVVIELHDPEKLARFGLTNRETVRPLYEAGYVGYWCGDHRAADATFERVTEMGEAHEKLSLMVLVPAEKLGGAV